VSVSDQSKISARVRAAPNKNFKYANPTDLLFARGALQLDVVHGEVGVEDDALVLLPGATVAERRRRR
jgi:hypothetical protein